MPPNDLDKASKLLTSDPGWESAIISFGEKNITLLNGPNRKCTQFDTLSAFQIALSDLPE
jgi:hypothetical protein